MLRHINAELYNNFYNSEFTTEQYITKNLQLNLNLLRQLVDVLYGCNPFINIYKIVVKQIQSFNINNIEEMYIILNLQMKLILHKSRLSSK